MAILTTQGMLIEDQKSARHFAVREAISKCVVACIFEGLMSVSHLANLNKTIDEGTNGFLQSFRDLSQMHLVGAPSTVKKVLAAISKITAARNEILKMRIEFENTEINRLVLQLQLSELSIGLLAGLVDPLVDAVIELRSELGFPLDGEAYRATMKEAIQQTVLQTTTFTKTLLEIVERRIPPRPSAGLTG